MTKNQRKFIFNLNRCTGCGACMVACTIETNKSFCGPRDTGNLYGGDTSTKNNKINKSFCEGGRGAVFSKRAPLEDEGKLINYRQVYTFNETRHPEIPLFNLSMACNHCELPACLRGCPAGAISKDPDVGAVVVDPKRCLGCKYCTWACPYDAPKFNKKEGVIEKCDFCVDRLKKGEAPACVCSCPTNALRLGDLKEDDSVDNKITGFTQTTLRPALEFKTLRRNQQVPEASAPPKRNTVDQLFESSQNLPMPKISLRSEWALLIFTSIAFVLVALMTAKVVLQLNLNPFLFVGTGIIGMGLSTIHLSQKKRALYAIRNIKYSWLSREILLFSSFLGASFIYLYFIPNQKVIGWVAVIIGYFSLWAVDRIYQVALQIIPLNFHSAQTILNGLFLTGALISNTFLFLIFGIIKLALYIYRKYQFLKQHKRIHLMWSILRISIGFVVPIIIFFLEFGASDNSNIISAYSVLIIFVLAGELIDRTEFYSELDIITPRKQMLIDMEELLNKKRGA